MPRVARGARAECRRREARDETNRWTVNGIAARGARWNLWYSVVYQINERHLMIVTCAVVLADFSLEMTANLRAAPKGLVREAQGSARSICPKGEREMARLPRRRGASAKTCPRFARFRAGSVTSRPRRVTSVAFARFGCAASLTLLTTCARERLSKSRRVARCCWIERDCGAPGACRCRRPAE